MHKFVPINIKIPNYLHYNIFQSIHLYEHSTTLILQETNLGCLKHSYLNNFLEFFYYYFFFQFILPYEYSTSILFYKSKLRCIKNCCLKKLFDFFIIYGLITAHNFVKINIKTPSHFYYNIIQSLGCEQYMNTKFAQNIIRMH
jgi:hypothetical protein